MLEFSKRICIFKKSFSVGQKLNIVIFISALQECFEANEIIFSRLIINKVMVSEDAMVGMSTMTLSEG